MPADFPVTELYQVLSGREIGRQNLAEVTVFDSVGFALEDYSALRFVNDLALRHGVGKMLDLVPTPADPKDLFQLVAPAAAGRRSARPDAVPV
jgi:ornithine cyclodeaminase